MKRLHGGPFLDMLLKNMENSANGTCSKKLYMFSAHDSSLTRIMNTLEIFKPHNPPYAAALMIELHQVFNENDFYVKVSKWF